MQQRLLAVFVRQQHQVQIGPAVAEALLLRDHGGEQGIRRRRAPPGAGIEDGPGRPLIGPAHPAAAAGRRRGCLVQCQHGLAHAAVFQVHPVLLRPQIGGQARDDARACVEHGVVGRCQQLAQVVALQAVGVVVFKTRPAEGGLGRLPPVPQVAGKHPHIGALDGAGPVAAHPAGQLDQ